MPALAPVSTTPKAVRPIPSGGVTTVLIVDDHQLIREALKVILNEDPAIQVFGEACNGAEAVEQALALQPDVVLMDVQMPGMSGIEAAARIKSQLPFTQVVMLTMHSTANYVVEAVRAGAVGYVLKDASKELLCETLKNASAGHILIKSEVLRQALTGLVRLPHSPRGKTNGYPNAAPQLSEREIEVLRLVTEGQTNRQIGVGLSISEETVKKHIQSIIAKLGALDRTHAAVKAVRAGLIH